MYHFNKILESKIRRVSDCNLCKMPRNQTVGCGHSYLFCFILCLILQSVHEDGTHGLDYKAGALPLVTFPAQSCSRKRKEPLAGKAPQQVKHLQYQADDPSPIPGEQAWGATPESFPLPPHSQGTQAFILESHFYK